MEATINAFKFILNKHLDLIEVYDDAKTSRPFATIKVEHSISEKDCHFEISDWYMNHSSNSGF